MVNLLRSEFFLRKVNGELRFIKNLKFTRRNSLEEIHSKKFTYVKNLQNIDKSRFVLTMHVMIQQHPDFIKFKFLW